MAYSTINKSSDYFNTKLYSGTGAIQTVSGVGFEPSWIWTKSRTNTGNHQITDQVRGLTKYIRTNATNAEDTKTNAVTAVNSDGFVLGADSSNDINASGQTYVSWNWKANGQGSSNTDGSINTTYTSANTTSGCSIITYTGTGANATIGHGLGMVPTFIIFRRYQQAENWNVYHHSIGAGKSLRLNETGAEANDATALNSTAPTSSLISLGSSVNTNASGNPMIAWCFSDVQGFSKAGSYIGAGGGGQPFIYTGFKPAFIITRNVTSAVDWGMFDNKRNEYNVVQNVLLPNNSAAETTGTAKYFDFLSNGFKVKNDSLQYNGTNEKHIYMAFAEAPLVGSNNVPCTAR